MKSPPACFLTQTNELQGSEVQGNSTDPSYFTIFETDDYVVGLRYYAQNDGPKPSAQGATLVDGLQRGVVSILLHSKTGSAKERFAGNALIHGLAQWSWALDTAVFPLVVTSDPDDPETMRLAIHMEDTGYYHMPSYESEDGQTIIFEWGLWSYMEAYPFDIGLRLDVAGTPQTFVYPISPKAIVEYNQPVPALFTDASGQVVVNSTADLNEAWAVLETPVSIAASVYSPHTNSYIHSGYTGGYGTAALASESGAAGWYMDLLIGSERETGETDASVLNRIYGQNQDGRPIQIDLSFADELYSSNVSANQSGLPVLEFGDVQIIGETISTAKGVILHFRLNESDLATYFGTATADFTFLITPDEERFVRVGIENTITTGQFYVATSGWDMDGKRSWTTMDSYPSLSPSLLENDTSPFTLGTAYGSFTKFARLDESTHIAVTDVNASHLLTPDIHIRRSRDNGQTWRTLGVIHSPEGKMWNKPMSVCEAHGRIYFTFLVDDWNEGHQSIGLAYIPANVDVIRPEDVVDMGMIQTVTPVWGRRPLAANLAFMSDGQMLVLVQSVGNDNTGVADATLTLITAAGDISHTPLVNDLPDAKDASCEFQGEIAISGNTIHLVGAAGQFTEDNFFQRYPQALYFTIAVDGLSATVLQKRWLTDDLNEPTLRSISSPRGLVIRNWYLVSTFENGESNIEDFHFGTFYALDLSLSDPQWFMAIRDSMISSGAEPHAIHHDGKIFIFGDLYNRGSSVFGGFELPMPLTPKMSLTVNAISASGDESYFPQYTRVIGGEPINDFETEEPSTVCFDASDRLFYTMTSEPAPSSIDTTTNDFNGFLLNVDLSNPEVNPEGHFINSIHVRGTFTASQTENPVLLISRSGEELYHPIQSGVPFDVTFYTGETRWNEWNNFELYIVAEEATLTGTQTLPENSVDVALILDEVRVCYEEVAPLDVVEVDAVLPGWAYGEVESMQWREGEALFTLPSFPIDYPPPYMVQLPPDAFQSFRAIASNSNNPGGTVDGGRDVGDKLLTAQGRVELTDHVPATPYSTGFGLLNASVWVDAVDGFQLNDLPEGYVLSSNLTQFADTVSRSGDRSIRANGEVSVRNMPGSVSVFISIAGAGRRVITAQPTINGSYSSEFTFDVDETYWTSPVDANGFMSGLGVYALTSTNQVMSSDAEIQFGVNIEYGVQPLPLLPLILRNVRTISYDDFPDLEQLGEYEIPADSSIGESHNDLIVMDDYSRFVLKGIPSVIWNDGIVVGDLYYTDDLETKLATIKIAGQGGA